MPPRVRAPKSKLRPVRRLGLVTLGGLLMATLTPIGAPMAATAPNVVIILSDDQRWDTIETMPNLQSAIAAQGVTYTNAMVPTSLCCPSRASILRGRYSHGTGVWANDAPNGGWPAFEASGGEDSNLGMWLNDAGYRTALIGKYLNNYDYAPAGHVPPGWDRWRAFVRTHYYDYDLVGEDGSAEHFGSRPADYSTDVIAAEADDFIRTTSALVPLFLYVAPYGTHSPFTPAPRHAGSCADLPRFRPPSYNEHNVSDKPGWLQRRPRWDSERRKQIDAFYRGACESLSSIDDLVGTVVTALADTGRLSNTLLIFASDNGFLWGEHRLVGKSQAYNVATRIPMAIRFDGVLPEGVLDDRLALNIDLAATIEQATGLHFPGLQGESLLGAPIRSGFPLEAATGEEQYRYRPAYCGWRTKTRIYVQYANGAAEFYNLRADPYELQNRIRVEMARPRISRMRRHAMAACSPTPPGFTW